MAEPLISVIIPAYNGGKYIKEALQSIFAQTYTNIEVIVVDDGSTDNTRSEVSQFEDVQYIYQENGGISSAMNTGHNVAKGEFFARVDQDDLWVKEKLDIQMNVLREQPELDMVFGHIEQFVSEDADSTKHHIPENLKHMPGIHSGTMLIKRASHFRVGLYNCEIALGEFIEWYIRAKEAGLKEVILPEVLMRRRIHDTNTGILKRDARGDYLRILKSSLDRRRKSGGQLTKNEPPRT